MTEENKHGTYGVNKHHDSKKVHSTHRVKKDPTKPWKWATGVLALLLLISLTTGWDISITRDSSVAGDSVVVDDSEDDSDSAVGAAVAAAYDPMDYYDEDDPFIGDENAPVTIVEFSDFECPFCARFHSGTLPSIIENYVDTGKVKLVYRDFPLSFHAEATPSALAAECAQDQDKFWEFHDLIFENQGDLGDDSYYEWAEEIELDMDQFTECYESQEHLAEVQADFSDGGQLGVSGTPAFFVNGVLVTGAQPYSVFESAIEAALS